MLFPIDKISFNDCLTYSLESCEKEAKNKNIKSFLSSRYFAVAFIAILYIFLLTIYTPNDYIVLNLHLNNIYSRKLAESSLKKECEHVTTDNSKENKKESSNSKENEGSDAFSKNNLNKGNSEERHKMEPESGGKISTICWIINNIINM